jgi:hypothetical protein
MAEHEPCIGQSDEWYTPPEIFAGLQKGGITCFDLDPCSAGADKDFVPANTRYTKKVGGLSNPWRGLVFMNPPFGGRRGHLPWLERFFAHANGIAIVRAYTSSDWWHAWMPRAHGILFPKSKTKFIRPDGTRGNQPGHGIALVGMGHITCEALKLGMYWQVV